MKILDRFWTSSTHNKIAVGMFALGAFIATLILTVHFQGIDSRVDDGGQKEMQLGELWVPVAFFMIVAPLVVKWDERRLRRQARERQRSQLREQERE